MMTRTDDSRGIKLVIATIVFLVLFAMSPTLYEWNARGRIHADRFFELVHNFPTDYNLYLSKIRQGKEGSWLAREKYTSEPHEASLSQVMYVLIGRLADWAHVQTPYVWFAYHAARLFFAGLLLWVIWKAAAWMFERHGFLWQYMAFLLIATQSTWPKFESIAGVPRLGGWMPWYTQADSLQRTTFMPHVLLAQALMIFIFWVFSNFAEASLDKSGGFITRRLSGNAVFLGIVGFVLGVIFPPGLVFIYGVLGIVSFGELFFFVIPGLTRNPKSRLQKMDPGSWAGMTLKLWFVKHLFDRIVFGVISAPTIIYFSLLLSQYPWKRLVEFDVLHPTKFSFAEYFMAVGPMLPLGLIGIFVLILAGKWGVLSKMKYFAAWIAAWLTFLFVFDKIPQQSPTRFTQMVPQMPLGLFAGYLFYSLWRVGMEFFGNARPLSKNYSASRNEASHPGISKKLPAQSSERFSVPKNPYLGAFLVKGSIVIPFAIILTAFASMASSYMWLKDFVDHKLRATIPLVPHNAEVMYPMRDIVEGLVWLQVNTPRSAVVMTGMTTGNYMPVYSGNTAYVGHANTVRLEEKMAVVNNFYQQHLTVAEELAYIKASGIDYIFYGPEEYELGGGIEDLRTRYPQLVEVYRNPMVRIYKTP